MTQNLCFWGQLLHTSKNRNIKKNFFEKMANNSKIPMLTYFLSLKID